MKRTILIIAAVVVILTLFLWGTYHQGLNVNIKISRADQWAYMEYAQALQQSNFKFVGDRNRMPVYPALMSFFYKEGMSFEVFHRYGIVVGGTIALVVAAVAFFIFHKVSSLFDASIATLVTMFSVLAYKAPYFQADVLFYGITLILFYLLISMIRRPRIWTALLAGITAAIGHLTKASVLPTILLAGICVLMCGSMDNKCQKNGGEREPTRRSRTKYFLTHFLYVLILISSFLVIVFPYIQTSKKIFGRYFYNVNSTFYLWYDSWDEARNGTKAHGDRVGWPDMPEDQIPSFQKYIREHSIEDIGNRIVKGSEEQWDRIIHSFGYAEFLAIYGFLILIIIGQNLNWFRSVLSRTSPSLLLFLLGYFAGYIFLNIWFTPLADGTRFMLALFLPALFILLSLISRAQSDDLRINFFGREFPISIVSKIVLLYLIVYLIFFYPVRVTNMFGGM